MGARQGKSWFRTAVSELIKGQTTAAGDYRYKKQNNDGCSGCWVPGWLGVRLDPKEPPRTRWSRAYKGHYSVRALVGTWTQTRPLALRAQSIACRLG